MRVGLMIAAAAAAVAWAVPASAATLIGGSLGAYTSPGNFPAGGQGSVFVFENGRYSHITIDAVSSNPFAYFNVTKTEGGSPPVTIEPTSSDSTFSYFYDIALPPAQQLSDYGRFTFNVNYFVNGPAPLSFSVLAYGDQLSPYVPEPATWALMILGFAIAAAALRRRPARPALV